MITYNLCLIKQKESILLLNRERAAWMGFWNGIGGKLEAGETPRESMLREIEEETLLDEYELSYKGLISWNVDGNRFGGMYLYLAIVSESLVYHTPRKMDEGILDWKEIRWILDPENQGVAANITRFLTAVLEEGSCRHYHCEYRDGEVAEQWMRPLNRATENEGAMNDYIQAYLGEGAQMA